MIVREASLADREQLARMWALLWPDESEAEHDAEIAAWLAYGIPGTLPGLLLVAEGQDGALAGFLHVGLRSHADGCDISQPVGFIEGWFVHEALRGQGIGRDLMSAAEAWAREHGCKEMASDTWIDHEDSQCAHAALGFEVVDRCVHFRKAL
jgi:aminoglycoside 6'-N-acetyltransferase I